MIRSLSILILPIASIVVFALMMQILGVLREDGGIAFVFAFGCEPLCWACSTACGLYAVKQNGTAFPKSELASKIFLYVSFISILASGVALVAGLDIGLLLLAFFVLFCGAVCCLISVFITFFIIVR
ncbi:MAG: hypothetical protein FWD31_13710, partial [Planctomycetaceae bacterium]|nr:hypothetical protein [Planctomycetaceae bacterium]